MGFPGGKGKTYPHVINLMPRHRVYIETHLGSGAVMRHKRPAERNIGIDTDDRVIARWGQSAEAYPGLELYCTKAETFLTRYPFSGEELIYVDPPYHPATRRRRRVYRHEYSEADHGDLLKLLVSLPCKVIVSGYSNSMYEHALGQWRTQVFRAKTHTDVRLETLWLNFEPPTDLHDTRYLGGDFRERERTKRRLGRLQQKLLRMEPKERAAIAKWLYQTFPSTPES